MTKEAREILIDIYLDYLNNYITHRGYANQNGLTVEEAWELIELARKVYYHKHPEA